jgi:FAD/FMN-containing dehydrogenase/Fe-S oxidoreductase
VDFGPGGRALYSTDASNYRQAPIGVVLPRDIDDVIATVAAARDAEAPILARGGGTSLAGQCCNAAVVLDFSRYLNHVVEIDPERRSARVEPGVILDHLRNQAERFHLTFGPDPATHNRCTLGGMIGNNSCGVHSVMAGMTDRNIDELDVLTYDGLRLRVGPTSPDELERIILAGGRRGEIYRGLKNLADRYADAIRTGFPDIPRRVSGFNLPALLPENGFHVARALVGTEGTCAVVLEATTRLVHSPRERSMVMLGYPDVYVACDQVPELLRHGPIGLEGFDDRLVEYMHRKNLYTDDVKKLPEGGGWLLVEFGGETAGEAEARARDFAQAIGGQANARVVLDHHEQERMWAVREAGLAAAAIVPDRSDMWPGWEDAAVPPARLGNYLRDLRALLERYGYDAPYYGHFGEGCVHMRVDFDFLSATGRRNFRTFVAEAADLCVGYGGSLSGEHGDGRARGDLLPRMYSAELIEAFRAFKTVWDPDNRMNPGNVVDPAPIDASLKLAEYRPVPVRTHFAYAEDGGSFAHAALRCVGVGRCRRESGGLMCPSYMVTREEQHSTRGRARLLFEMLQGDVLVDGWRDEHVREALDLCLACKGCKGECPVSVDMATYKAEFLAHYYAGRPRPPAAYAFGLIMYWARLASRMPGLANLVAPLGKRLIGIAPERTIPRFAKPTFKAWFRRRARRVSRGATGAKRQGADAPVERSARRMAQRGPAAQASRVVLWPDTWSNYFHPEIAQAAVDVLEAAGCEVRVPRRNLCCGRPVYDFGMLDLGKRLLRQVLDALDDEIRAGTPFVVLEPSCATVFRDELLGLFPHDDRAQRLARQTFLFGEFVQTRLDLRELDGKALVHGHCHQKALMSLEPDEALLERTGLAYKVLDSGCCGMAGAFGFEQEHYQVSIAAGERVLLPAVRRAAPDTLIVADGFSCREQIRQTTGREPLHLAQVLRRALQ